MGFRHHAHHDLGPEKLARVLYEVHGSALEHWARRRFVDDPQLAEEVVQETVLTAWRKYDQYDPVRGGERAWMFGIARNVASTQYRKNRRHLRAVPTGARSEADNDSDVDRVVERSLVVDAMALLSNNHRAVVAAAYWEGLSIRQIAERFGIPDGTVKSRLYYALRALRSALEEREILT